MKPRPQTEKEITASIRVIKYNFFIPGRLPGMNEIIGEARKSKFASADQKGKQTQRIGWHIGAALFHYKPIKPMKKVWVDLKWMEKDRRRDPDNIVAGKKFIMDGLVLSGLLKNDGWSQIAGFTDTWEVGELGVWVEVREV